MLSSNSEPNPQQPRFRLLRICFARKSDCKTKNPLPEADFLCRNVGESADYANFAEVQAGKLPHGVGTESQSWKAPPRRGHGIPKLENFPTAWAQNPKAGKLPHSVGTESQSWKASPQRGRGIPAINRRGRVCLPECAHNTYVDVFGRANPAPTR